MKHYVQIHAYMTANAIKNQLNKIKDENLFDKDLIVFFGCHQMVAISDMAYMLHYFDAIIDTDFSKETVIFIPQDWVIQNIEADKNGFRF